MCRITQVVERGSDAKTIDYCFGKRNRPKQGVDKDNLLSYISDYATVEGAALTEISSSHSVVYQFFNLIQSICRITQVVEEA